MSLNIFLQKGDFESDIPINRKIAIEDSAYWDFIDSTGDGFYINNSLHIYGTSSKFLFHDVFYRNELIHNLYKDFINQKIICFGEDAFGNQFLFYPQGIGLLSIETGDIEFIAQNFSKWMVEFENSIDYYSGESLMIEWIKTNEISLDERLTPKIPFVLGGEYEIGNLYKAKFNSILEFNSDLAIQIRDLADGASINLKIID